MRTTRRSAESPRCVYGADDRQWAFIKAIGLGANRRQNAVFPTSEANADGQTDSGANRSVIRFAKGNSPPVNAFWSITMYDADDFFVPNALNRRTVDRQRNLEAARREDRALNRHGT